MAYLENLLNSWYEFLMNIGPTLGMLIILLAGVFYGISYFQPSEGRGKMQKRAVEMGIGGVVILAIVGAAEIIKTIAMSLLT